MWLFWLVFLWFIYSLYSRLNLLERLYEEQAEKLHLATKRLSREITSLRRALDRKDPRQMLAEQEIREAVADPPTATAHPEDRSPLSDDADDCPLHAPGQDRLQSEPGDTVYDMFYLFFSNIRFENDYHL